MAVDLTNQNNRHIILARGELSETAADFLNFCLEVRYGVLEVQVKNGEPVMSKVIEQWHKHD